MLKLTSIGSVLGPLTVHKEHSHPQWELIYYLNGSGSIVIDGDTFDFDSESVFIIPPNVVHKESSVGGFTNIYARFSSDSLPMMVFNSNDTQSRDIYTLLMMLQREYLLNNPTHEAVRTALIGSAIEYVSALSEHRVANPFVERMREAVLLHFAEPGFSTRSIYLAVDINPDYARRLFVKEMGHSPGHFLRQTRINHAKELLKRSDKKATVYDVAVQCGFVDQYLFSKVFKKMTGLSPTEWKHQH